MKCTGRHAAGATFCAVLFALGSVSAFSAAVEVPGDRAWTDTGIDLAEGETFRVEARGKVEITHPRRAGRDGFERLVGPEGTYLYETAVKDRAFPLPAAEGGPSPCYALIGRIGADGAPFLVGRERRMTAPTAGRLHLGINDFDVADNTGAFTARIDAGGAVGQPAPEPDDVVYRAVDLPEGRPVRDARVVILYVDGLRYDVLREMAASGHLPAITEIFFDGGTDFASAFSGFPSSTLASNGTIYTGMFANRSGIKGNNWFDRKRRRGGTYLEPFGATVAADRMRPAGVRALGTALTRGVRALTSRGRARNAADREEEIPLLQDYVCRAGMEYYSTIAPILPLSPPNRYEVDGATVVPPFRMHRAADYADTINLRYGLDLVLQPDARLMNFWFPGVDSACHESPRAQFGGGRRPLRELDRAVAAIAAELKRKKIWDRTYLILLADHGTSGGRNGVIYKVDIARDLFFRPDTGLGVDVRWYDDGYLSAEAGGGGFAYVDHGEGECGVYLPHASIDSGDWLRRNTLCELRRYRLGGEAGEVDLVERMLAWDLGDEDPFPGRIGGRPVGQLLVKLDDRRAAVFGQEGTQALIEREPSGRRRWRYRYLPATMIDCTPGGAVRWEGGAGGDPFGYLAAGLDAAWMGEFHSEREWIEATKYCLYPDAVVSVAAQLFWDGPMAAREARFSPDMILCAAPGWAFAPPGEPSGAHGYLTYESAHIPFLVAGPNVRGGIVLTNAVRTADLVPTVLELLGIRFDPERFDGKPVNGFLKAEGEEKPPRPGESLQALLAKLPYGAAEPDAADIRADYARRVEERRPGYLVPDARYRGHDLQDPKDVHVIGANLFGILNREVLADLDNLYDLVHTGDRKRPLTAGIRKLIEGYDALPDRYPKERVRELLFALQIPEVTIGEVPSAIFLSWTGLAGRGVVFRACLLLKWIEHLFSDMDAAILYPAGSPKVRLVSNANYLFGGMRATLDAVSWGATYYIGNALYDGVYRVEKWHERSVRARRGHQGPAPAWPPGPSAAGEDPPGQ